MQHDKAIDEPVLTREWIVARPWSHGPAIGPVLDHRYLGWVRAFTLNEPPLHRVAEGDDPCRFSYEKSVHSGQRRIYDIAVKVFQQRSDFRKDVLAKKDEWRMCFRCCRKRRETDD